MNAVLIHITPNADIQKLTELCNLNPKPYILFIPNRLTTPTQSDSIHQLIQTLQIPPENYIEINIESIVQKTWRIIKHYESTLPLSKGEPEGVTLPLSKGEPEGVTLPLSKGEPEGVLPKGEPNRKTHNARLAQANRLRLRQIQTQIEKIIIQDQATRLQAKILKH